MAAAERLVGQPALSAVLVIASGAIGFMVATSILNVLRD